MQINIFGRDVLDALTYIRWDYGERQIQTVLTRDGEELADLLTERIRENLKNVRRMDKK